jgi:hypothetical protein
MEKLITYVGLDVHKETISVAVVEGGDRGEARYFGKIANSAQALSAQIEALLPDWSMAPTAQAIQALRAWR